MRIDKRKVELIRARNQISVSDLKRKGVSQGNLNSLYNNRSMLPETVGKIAKALGVDVKDIVQID